MWAVWFLMPEIYVIKYFYDVIKLNEMIKVTLSVDLLPHWKPV